MTRPLIIAGAGIAGLALSLLAATCAEARDEPDQRRLIATAPLSTTCEDGLEGAGAERESAIDVSVDELFAEAEWAASQGSISDYNCRWVRLRGHFRWVDYWHYEGRLYEGLLDVYRRDARSIWIEAFADSGLRRAEVHGFELDLSGRHYDLCAMDAQVARGENEWIFGGPCSHGPFGGLMLTDVEVTARVSTGSQRLRGEINREPLGDLLRLDDEVVIQVLRQVTQEWVESARPPSASTPTAQSQAQAEAGARHLQRLENPDTWLRLLADPDLSPFNRLADPEAAPFAAFVSRLDVEDPVEGEEGVSAAYGCFCLSADCENKWPLFDADAWRMTDDYVCTEFERIAGVWRTSR